MVGPKEKHTHEQAMAIINATSRVVALTYEEAIIVYLRARHILKDKYAYLASPLPTDWDTPTAEPPKANPPKPGNDENLM